MRSNWLILVVLIVGVGYYIGSDIGLFEDPVKSALDQHRDLMDRFNARN